MAKESALQARIRNRLRRDGWLVVKISLTSRPGWPDLEAIRDGRTIRIEVKDHGDLKPHQKYRHSEIKKYGGEVYSADSWEKFLELGLD